jgi:hypothetical protein
MHARAKDQHRTMIASAPSRSQKRSQESSFLKKRSKRLLLPRRFHDPGDGRDHDAGAGKQGS